MRKTPISPGEYYHILNRGNDKQNIFRDDRDRIRFLFLLLYLQGKESFPNAGRVVTHFVQHRVFNIEPKIVTKITKEKHIELISFALMPNHFHLILGEKIEGGIAHYMQRLLNAYTKFFNIRYKRSGHLLQGPYRAIHLEDNEQLLYTSAYVHRNCRTLTGWKNREELYPWSSLQDYIIKNRWGDLLDKKLIQEQFSKPSEYKEWVATSGAKDPLNLIDPIDLEN
ncbi:MAG: transposase [Candidatus Vogelbacteria bacterium]